MIYFIVYVIIGLLFCCLFRMDDDRPVIADPLLTFLFVITWPFLLWYYLGKTKRIKWKGKVVWERK